MIKTEEELEKNTLIYKFNAFGDACQKLKELVIREYSKPFLIVCAFVKGIQAAIKQEREYDQVLKSLSSPPSSTSNVNTHPNPEIILIHQTTPFTYKKAEDIYNLSKKYNIPIDILTTYCISSGVGVGVIERAIEEKLNKR